MGDDKSVSIFPAFALVARSKRLETTLESADNMRHPKLPYTLSHLTVKYTTKRLLMTLCSTWTRFGDSFGRADRLLLGECHKTIGRIYQSHLYHSQVYSRQSSHIFRQICTRPWLWMWCQLHSCQNDRCHQSGGQ
jgi:hypothetical protein